MANRDSAEIEAHLDANREQRMADYRDFLRIPSISALPSHNPDSHRAAEWVAGKLTEAGLDHVSVEETGGNPIVYGDLLGAGPGAPTVIVYCHYDVQPVDPLDLWESPPFRSRVEKSGSPWSIGEPVSSRYASSSIGRAANAAWSASESGRTSS